MLTRIKKDYIIDLLKAYEKVGGDSGLIDKGIGYLNEGPRPKANPNKTEVANPIPTLNELIAYFTENGYSAQGAVDAHKYYSDSVNPSTGQKDGYWYDSRGQRILSWKMKARSVWFQDRYKIKSEESPNKRRPLAL